MARRRMGMGEAIRSLGGPVPYFGFLLLLLGPVGAVIGAIGVGKFGTGQLPPSFSAVGVIVSVALGLVGALMMRSAGVRESDRTLSLRILRAAVALGYVAAAAIMYARGGAEPIILVAATVALLAIAPMLVLLREP